MNIADALTKNVESELIKRHMKSSHQEIVDGRHELAPAVSEK